MEKQVYPHDGMENMDILAMREALATKTGFSNDYFTKDVSALIGEEEGTVFLVAAPADSTIVPLYEISFDMGGITEVPETLIVKQGQTAPIPTPPSVPGHLFMGWYTDSEMSTEFDATAPIHADTVLYAKFVDYEEEMGEVTDSLDDLREAINDLREALEEKADTETIEETLAAMQESINALAQLLEDKNSALSNQIDSKDEALLEEVLKEVDAAKQAAIDAAKQAATDSAGNTTQTDNGGESGTPELTILYIVIGILGLIVLVGGIEWIVKDI